MKQLALTAVAGFAATALTAALVAPAVGDPKVHTLRLISRDLASHELGAKTFAGTAVDRHAGQRV